MVKVLERLFGSFVSALAYCFFPYQDNGVKSRRKNFRKMSKRRPLSLQTVELKVRMCCTGCERVVKEAIRKLRGVNSIEVDLEMERVTVIGHVDRNKVLKAVRRSGKRAEFWPYPTPPLYFTSTSHYFKDMTIDYKESYNYWRHGYNATDRHGSLPVTFRGDDKVERVTMIGHVDRNQVLKAVRRIEKRAEFWPYPNPPLYFMSTSHYFKDMTIEYKESYNYWRHGYNAANRHSPLPVTFRGDDKVSSLFNYGNVNACCVM